MTPPPDPRSAVPARARPGLLVLGSAGWHATPREGAVTASLRRQAAVTVAVRRP